MIGVASSCPISRTARHSKAAMCNGRAALGCSAGPPAYRGRNETGGGRKEQRIRPAGRASGDCPHPRRLRGARARYAAEPSTGHDPCPRTWIATRIPRAADAGRNPRTGGEGLGPGPRRAGPPGRARSERDAPQQPGPRARCRLRSLGPGPRPKRPEAACGSAGFGQGPRRSEPAPGIDSDKRWSPKQ